MNFDLVMWPLTLSCDLQVRHNVKIPIVHLWSKFGYNWSEPVRTGAIWKRLTETLTDGRTHGRTNGHTEFRSLCVSTNIRSGDTKNMITRERWFDKRRSNEKMKTNRKWRKRTKNNQKRKRKIERKKKKITFLFHSFKMLCISYIIFSTNLYLFSIYPFSCLLPFCSSFFLFSFVPLSFFLSFFLAYFFLSSFLSFSFLLSFFFLLKHAAILIQRIGHTCMTKEQNEMLMLMN